jgi:hypothetical protein
LIETEIVRLVWPGWNVNVPLVALWSSFAFAVPSIVR